MSSDRRLVAVLGTGTGVGKTVVSAAILRSARAKGLDVAGLKPIQTGTDEPTDAELLAEASGHPVVPRYLYKPPISPHLAARLAGEAIELSQLNAWVRRHSRAVTLVETAGGAFSPVTDRETNADFAHGLSPFRTVLVCSAALGAFHATRATLSALRSEAPSLLERLVVVVSSPESQRTAREVSAEILHLMGRQFQLREPIAIGPGGSDDTGSREGLWLAISGR